MVVNEQEYNEQYQINRDRFSLYNISPVEIQPRDEHGNPEWPARLVNVVHWAKEREETGKGLVNKPWGPVEDRRYIRLTPALKANIIACRNNKQLPLVEWKYQRPEMDKFFKEQFQEKQQERFKKVLDGTWQEEQEERNRKLQRKAEREEFKDVKLLKHGARYHVNRGGKMHAYWRNVRLQHWREMNEREQGGVKILASIDSDMTSGQREFPKGPFPPIPTLKRASSMPSPNRRKYGEPDPTQVTPERLNTLALQGDDPLKTPVAGDSNVNMMEYAGFPQNTSSVDSSPVETQKGSPPTNRDFDEKVSSHSSSDDSGESIVDINIPQVSRKRALSLDSSNMLLGDNEWRYPKYHKGDKEEDKHGGKKKKRKKRTKKRRRKKKKTRKSKRKKKRTKKKRRKRKKRTRRRR